MIIQSRTRLVKETAYKLGFEFVGISKAEKMEEESFRLEQWLKNNMHGKMQYMENHFEKRTDPTKLVEGSKSVVTLLYNYFPTQEQEDSTAPKLAKYAYGKDYHFVIKDKLKTFLNIVHTSVDLCS